jgi:hypothetical protein
MLRELLDEDVDLVEDDAELEDELDVRSTMIVVRQLEAEAEKTAKTGRKVAERYAAKASALIERADFLRAKLFRYVSAHGKTAFPDVGTAYTTATKPKLIIEDKELVEREFGETFAKSVFDESDFKAWALEQFERTGEIPVGCDVRRADRTLAMRQA